MGTLSESRQPAVASPPTSEEENVTQAVREPWTCGFIAALITIAKTWKQPWYSSVDEWIKKKLWYIYAVNYYSAIKRKEGRKEGREEGKILPFVMIAWMDLEIIMLNELSQVYLIEV